MKAVLTVLGHDKIGIIYHVTKVLAENKVNVLDISQTILQNFFTMVMIVDLAACPLKFEELQERLNGVGEEMELSIRIQHQDIFDSMHRI